MRVVLSVASLSLLLGGTLAGCGSTSSAAGDTARYLWRSSGKVEAPLPTFQPAYRYLRVKANDSVVWMVLGYIDHDVQGEPVEVWYSADHEVLRLQHGRLLGLEGTPVQWQRVQWSPAAPAWPAGHDATRWTRTVDEREGRIQRAGRHLDLTVKAVEAPTDSALAGMPAQGLRWYEVSADDNPLPPARYAFRPAENTPVYGEQCLSRQFCLTWQYWFPHP